MNSLIEGTNVFENIKQRAEKNGMTIPQLCKETGISYFQLNSWKDKNPKSIETLKIIDEYFNSIEGLGVNEIKNSLNK